MNKTKKTIMKGAVIFGIIILPLIYSITYLKGFWDPYNNLGDMKVAIVNNDKCDSNCKSDILIDKLDINANQDVATASGGEKKKASLAHALIQEPDILLLDEPTNHLDIVTIEKLEEIIQNFSGAVVVISHDRRFLTNISTATIWLDRGSLHVNDKGYAFFNEWQEEIINQEIIEQKRVEFYKQVADVVKVIHHW